MTDESLDGVANYLFEMGLLKHAKRTGWWIAGVKDPETIAEHSFRTAILGTMLASLEGADPARVAVLCLFHDTQETRVGDIPHIGRRYLTAAENEAVTRSATSSASTSGARRSRRSSRTTPTSSNASSRRWNTANRATARSSGGSTAVARS
jgi:putative hydrolases of HD superfamily